MTTRTIVVTCRKCGQDYEATGDMIVSGMWMKACPVCYPRRDDAPAAA
jgi:hypothetical protein